MSQPFQISAHLYPNGIDELGNPQFTVATIPVNDSDDSIEVDYAAFDSTYTAALETLTAANVLVSDGSKSYTTEGRLVSMFNDEQRAAWREVFAESGTLILPGKKSKKSVLQNDEDPQGRLNRLLLKISEDANQFGSNFQSFALSGSKIDIDLSPDELMSRDYFATLKGDWKNGRQTFNQTCVNYFTAKQEVDSFFRKISPNLDSVNEKEPFSFWKKEPENNSLATVIATLTQHPFLARGIYGLFHELVIDSQGQDLAFWPTQQHTFTRRDVYLLLNKDFTDPWYISGGQPPENQQTSIATRTSYAYMRDLQRYHGDKNFGLRKPPEDTHQGGTVTPGYYFLDFDPSRYTEAALDFIEGSQHNVNNGSGMVDQSRMRSPKSEGLFLIYSQPRKMKDIRKMTEGQLGVNVIARDTSDSVMRSLCSRRAQYTVGGKTWTFPEEGWIKDAQFQRDAEGKLIDTQVGFWWQGRSLGSHRVGVDSEHVSGGDNVTCSGLASVFHDLVSTRLLTNQTSDGVWLEAGKTYEFLQRAILTNGYCIPLSTKNPLELTLPLVNDDELIEYRFSMSDKYRLNDPIQPPYILSHREYDDPETPESAANVVLRSDKDRFERRYLMPAMFDLDQMACFGVLSKNNVVGKKRDAKNDYINRCLKLLLKSKTLRPATISANESANYFPDIRATKATIRAGDWITHNWAQEVLGRNYNHRTREIAEVDLHDFRAPWKSHKGRELEPFTLEFRSGKNAVNKKKGKLVITAVKGTQLQFQVAAKPNQEEGYQVAALESKFYTLFGGAYEDPQRPHSVITFKNVVKKPQGKPIIQGKNPALVATRLRSKSPDWIYLPFRLDSKQMDSLTTKLIRFQGRHRSLDSNPAQAPKDLPPSRINSPLISGGGEFSIDEAFGKDSGVYPLEGLYPNGFGMSLPIFVAPHQFNDRTELYSFAYSDTKSLSLDFHTDISDPKNPKGLARLNLDLSELADKDGSTIDLPTSSNYKFYLEYKPSASYVSTTGHYDLRETGSNKDLGLAVVLTISSQGDFPGAEKNKSTGKYARSVEFDSEEFGLPSRAIDDHRLAATENIWPILVSHSSTDKIQLLRTNQYFLYENVHTPGYRLIDVAIEQVGKFAKYYPEVNEDNLDRVRSRGDQSYRLTANNNSIPPQMEYRISPLPHRTLTSTPRGKIRTARGRLHWLIEITRGQEDLIGQDWRVGLIVGKKQQDRFVIDEDTSSFGRDVTTFGEDLKDASSLVGCINNPSPEAPYIFKYAGSASPVLREVAIGADLYQVMLLVPHYMSSKDCWSVILDFDSKAIADRLQNKNLYNPFAKLVTVRIQENSELGYIHSEPNKPIYLPLMTERNLYVEQRTISSTNLGAVRPKVKITPAGQKIGANTLLAQANEVGPAMLYAACLRERTGDGLLGRKLPSSLLDGGAKGPEKPIHYFQANGSDPINFQLTTRNRVRDRISDYELCLYEFETFYNTGQMSERGDLSADPFSAPGYRLTFAEKFQLIGKYDRVSLKSACDSSKSEQLK